MRVCERHRRQRHFRNNRHRRPGGTNDENTHVEETERVQEIEGKRLDARVNLTITACQLTLQRRRPRKQLISI